MVGFDEVSILGPGAYFILPQQNGLNNATQKTTSATTILLIFAFLHYPIRSRLVYLPTKIPNTSAINEGKYTLPPMDPSQGYLDNNSC